MYRELSKKEIKKFIKRYLNSDDEYTKNINHISVIEFNGVKEYRIDHKWTLKIYK